MRSVRQCFCLLLAGATASCVLAPSGFDPERDRADRFSERYAKEFAQREFPALSPAPSWREILERAFLANGELEVAYFEWKAALDRVTMVAGWPDTNLMPSLSYLFSSGGMKAWDRTTVGFGFDPMQSLSLPSKVRKAGEIALEEAREAGSRFAAAKFALQRRVLDNWLELALLDERARVQAERVGLARLASDSAAQRAAVDGDQRELLRAQVEQQMAEIELDGLHAEVRAARAMLNGMLAHEADVPLDLVDTLPDARAVPADDAALIAAGVENNPELRALAFAVSAREDALDLARLQFLPDFNPFAGFTGSIEQMVGVGVSLPTRVPQIRAGIAEAGARLRGASAELRQSGLDRRASFVAALYMLRYSERQAQFFERGVRSAAEQASDSVRQAYSTGAASFDELLDAQSVLLDVRLAVAEARIERERRLAELEELAGLDIETLATQPEQAGHPTGDEHHE